VASNLRIAPASDVIEVSEVRTLTATDATSGDPVASFWWINPTLTGEVDIDDDHLVPQPSSAVTFVDASGNEFADVSTTPVATVKLKGKSLDYTETGDFGTVRAARELFANTSEWQDETDLINYLTYVTDRKCFYKIAELETEMEPVDDGGQKVFRYVPGIRMRLQANFISNALTGTNLFWSAATGTLFGGYGRGEGVIPPASANGFALNEIFWEPPDDLSDAVVNFQVKIDDEVLFTTEFKFRARSVATGSSGDDAEILQRLLFCFGHSEGGTPGVQGTPVSIDGSFGAKSTRALKRFQSADEISQSGTLDDDTLTRLLEHYRDYQAAFDRFSTSPFIDQTHPSFPTWVAAGAVVLSATLTNAILASIQAGLTRDAILREWVKHETDLAHWGFNGRDFRVSIGSADEFASFGFNQILNKYRYGVTSQTPQLATLNFYDPADSIRALAVFSNTPTAGAGSGGGFAKAFNGATPVYKVTTTFGAGTFPRLGASYTDDFKDLLSKGIMAYNRGSSLGEFTTLTWPEFLKAFDPPPPGAGFGTSTAMNYTLAIQNNAGVALRTWTWTDKEDSTTFSFTFSESEWLSGKSWTAKRDESAPT
jgi:peptidoglycan hydrolase-like protein with peptidoglycan-binding domain